MILQLLHRAAQAENLVEDPDIQWLPVRFSVRIDRDGRWMQTDELAIIDRRNRSIVPAIPVPSQMFAARTSNVLPYFLVDKGEYALGTGSGAKSAARFESFRDFVERALPSGDQALLALARFLASPRERERAIGGAGIEPAEIAGARVAFRVDGDPGFIHDREVPRRWFSSWRRHQEGSDREGVCMVTGERGPLAVRHPRIEGHRIRGLRGVLTTGASLVSFNFPSAEAYGFAQEENAPIGRRTAEGVATALNRLLHPAYPAPGGRLLPRQFALLSPEAVAVYWTDPPGAVEPGFLDALVSGDAGGLAGRVAQLASAVERTAGVPPRIHFLVLSFAQGRVVVRALISRSAEEIAGSLSRYLAEVDLRDGSAPPSLAGLIGGSGNPVVDSRLAMQGFRAVLEGGRLPAPLLRRTLNSVRAAARRGAEPLARENACLLQLWLARWQDGSPSTAFMDETNTSAPYLLGRLLAVLAKLQAVALGREPNVGLVSRYYTMASTTPARGFGILLRRAVAYRDQAARGRWPGYGRQLFALAAELSERIAGPLGGRLPARMSVEDQAAFGLGFYAQTNALNRVDQGKPGRRGGTRIEETDGPET